VCTWCICAWTHISLPVVTIDAVLLLLLVLLSLLLLLECQVQDESKLSESELGRVVTMDGTKYVCSDADFEKELAYLKSKVDAGAEFIVTQVRCCSVFGCPLHHRSVARDCCFFCFSLLSMWFRCSSTWQCSSVL